MGNLDNRIANADQLLTQDVEKFCSCVVDLYSNLTKVTSCDPPTCTGPALMFRPDREANLNSIVETLVFLAAAGHWLVHIQVVNCYGHLGKWQSDHTFVLPLEIILPLTTWHDGMC